MKYTQQLDGEPFTIEKRLVIGGPGNGSFVGTHKIACCDCGLVHTLNIYNGCSEMTLIAWRDNRATAQKRRHKKYSCVPRKKPCAK